MNSKNPDSDVPPQKSPPPKPGQGVQLVSGVESPKDAKTMAMLTHLLGGVFGVLGSLIVWLLKKDEDPFIDQEGKEATNFQILIVIAHVIGFVILFVSCGVLFFIPLVVWAVGLIFGIIGGMQANNGHAYRYPFNVRLIK